MLCPFALSVAVHSSGLSRVPLDALKAALALPSLIYSSTNAFSFSVSFFFTASLSGHLYFQLHGFQSLNTSLVIVTTFLFLTFASLSSILLF
jgi:hypothetical protein